MRAPRCEHDPVYSGQINLNQRFAWICRKCGEHGWSESYRLSLVNADEYHRLRVMHGWGGKLPAPPRLPTAMTPRKPDASVVIGVSLFAALAAVCALCAIPWGKLGPILPLWMALLGAGVALGTATVLYLILKGTDG